jgi:hypothetical protein
MKWHFFGDECTIISAKKLWQLKVHQVKAQLKRVGTDNCIQASTGTSCITKLSENTGGQDIVHLTSLINNISQCYFSAGTGLYAYWQVC